MSGPHDWPVLLPGSSSSYMHEIDDMRYTTILLYLGRYILGQSDPQASLHRFDCRLVWPGERLVGNGPVDAPTVGNGLIRSRTQYYLSLSDTRQSS